MISQKCQYGLRAVFELAQKYGQGPVKVAEIARIQAIPPRFLEVILAQLKQARFVASERGRHGGYYLVHEPKSLTMGDIIRYLGGPIGPVRCVTGKHEENCPLHGDCVFLPVWEKAQTAMADVYDSTTFADLAQQEKHRRMCCTPSYSI